MSIIVNHVGLSIDIKETFTFNKNVVPILKEIKKELEDFAQSYKCEEEQIIEIENFIRNSLSDREKLEIINNVIFIYEHEHWFDIDSVLIFDESIIRKAILIFLNDYYPNIKYKLWVIGKSDF